MRKKIYSREKRKILSCSWLGSVVNVTFDCLTFEASDYDVFIAFGFSSFKNTK